MAQRESVSERTVQRVTNRQPAELSPPPRPFAVPQPAYRPQPYTLQAEHFAPLPDPYTPPPPRPLPPGLAASAEGETVRQVAAREGVDPGTVSRVAQRHSAEPQQAPSPYRPQPYTLQAE